jgi:hypothetical protein
MDRHQDWGRLSTCPVIVPCIADGHCPQTSRATSCIAVMKSNLCPPACRSMAIAMLPDKNPGSWILSNDSFSFSLKCQLCPGAEQKKSPSRGDGGFKDARRCFERKCREPRACGAFGAPERGAHIRQTHQGRMSGDIGPIAQHGSSNFVGGWGTAVCLTTRAFEITCRACGSPLSGREGKFVLKYFLLREAIRRRRGGAKAN